MAYPSSRTETERAIAGARVVLAVSSILVLWLDPLGTSPTMPLVNSMVWIYAVWSVAVAVFMWSWTWSGANWLPLATHIVDIATFSRFQYLTFGASSPFFVYFLFSMFCGAVRWGWRGTLATGGVVAVAYLIVAQAVDPTTVPEAITLNRAAIQGVYLLVVGGPLVYMGLYEERLRREIDSLTQWPAIRGATIPEVLEPVLAHAAGIIGARRALVVWEVNEEPAVMSATWSTEGLKVSKHGPDEFVPIMEEGLEHSTFLCTTRPGAQALIVVKQTGGRLRRRPGVPLHPGLLSMVEGRGITSAAFRTDHLSGRAVFSDLTLPSTDVMPLVEVVAREIGGSLDQLLVTQQRQALAAREERIRLARNLHDGVLQALTGVRLELRAISDEITHAAPASGAGAGPDTRTRLLEVEHTLAVEQRELRYFVDGTKPIPAQSGESLSVRLERLRERLALQWRTPVTIRVAPDSRECSPEMMENIPLMVHEAIVNALKHAQPTQIEVVLNTASDGLHIIVSDNGRGFPFKGRYDHNALASSGVAPRSLFDRVAALGGRMVISSSDRGSRVEMVVTP